jgi:hypothetical protein
MGDKKEKKHCGKTKKLFTVLRDVSLGELYYLE